MDELLEEESRKQLSRALSTWQSRTSKSKRIPRRGMTTAAQSANDARTEGGRGSIICLKSASRMKDRQPDWFKEEFKEELDLQEKRNSEKSDY